jgi:hypothetical protein
MLGGYPLAGAVSTIGCPGGPGTTTAASLGSGYEAAMRSSQPAWPQLQASSTVSPASWQYSLQYRLPGSAAQLQAGCAHFVFSAISVS